VFGENVIPFSMFAYSSTMCFTFVLSQHLTGLLEGMRIFATVTSVQNVSSQMNNHKVKELDHKYKV
jgi:uncharacterized membrane protein YesL